MGGFGQKSQTAGVTPTTILRVVIAMAARTEWPATARFSARINSELEGVFTIAAVSL